ncbi:MAG: RNA polymerase sigma factor [Porphyromonas sp.]|nr:RNA polymerase sigma factor [Porphyromonas sp.]
MTKDKQNNNFEEELIGLQPNMFSFALSLTADRFNAEDLLQETSLKVLANREKYKPNTNFKGWVFTVMRNLFINNYHRGVRTQKIIDDSADLSYLGSQKDTEGLGTPDHELSLKEINEAIESLDEAYQVPFSLYLSGFKYKEIADQLELPIGTVKSRIFFARKQLQSSLQDFR